MIIYCVKVKYSGDSLHACLEYVSYFSHQPTLNDMVTAIAGDWETNGEYERDSFLANTLNVITGLTENGIPQLPDQCVSGIDYWPKGQGSVEVIKIEIIMNNHEEGTGT